MTSTSVAHKSLAAFHFFPDAALAVIPHQIFSALKEPGNGQDRAQQAQYQTGYADGAPLEKRLDHADLEIFRAAGIGTEGFGAFYPGEIQAYKHLLHAFDVAFGADAPAPDRI